MKAKQILSDFFWFPITSKSKIELYQERIRQLEWNSVKPYVKVGASFLDVGCGTGYSLMKAHQDFDCIVQGIDPDPGAHGVGRFTENLWKYRPIIQGNAESLPFEDDTFDIVYSSHVLEHVTNEDKALQEMRRVLKPDGVLIIGMPTAAISWVALFSSWLFTTHISIYHFIRSISEKDVFSRFIRIFMPCSHSYPRAKHITYDLIHYRISQWQTLVSRRFVVKKVITPGLYPYPDYIQWFPLLKIGSLSSSVFFICVKD